MQFRDARYSPLDVTTPGLSTTWAAFPLTHDTSDPMSCVLPQRVWLDHLEINVESIGGGATSITTRFTWDADGDELAQPEVTTTIATGITTTAKGGIVLGIDGLIVAPAGKTLYIQMKLDAGTADVTTGRMFWGL